MKKEKKKKYYCEDTFLYAPVASDTEYTGSSKSTEAMKVSESEMYKLSFPDPPDELGYIKIDADGTEPS